MNNVIKNWKLVYAHHDACCGKEFYSIQELETSGFDILPASVPGQLEVELMKAGKLQDIYFSTNTLQAQELEDVHVWYYTEVEITKANQYLRFEGIDTFADIYVNGEFAASSDNMYLPCDVKADWKMGKNEVIVHIRPTVLEARKFTPPAYFYSNKYGTPSLYVRKAPHTFGWDILPRIVSAGLWKEVHILESKADQINEVAFCTHKIVPMPSTADGQPGQGLRAQIRFYITADLSHAMAKEYTVKIEGRCGDSTFEEERELWHNTQAFNFVVKNCKLWWPKNAGEQNLYDTKVTLLHKGEVCDTYELKIGIRTVELDRTEITDENGSGEFCFKVNGKKIFILGTNWIALDALHSNDGNRLAPSLEMLDDIGCNMVRCWGGNVYETDEFFDFCDEHGILVWQDFAMGCCVYPDEEVLRKALEKEAIYQIKRLRNHASLAVWAGDNECDIAHNWAGYDRNPTGNSLNRHVLRRAVEMHDYTRPYLPSSPYVSEEAFKGKGLMPENHLWGPRDYFKGEFYRNTFCHFASETGYHAFPALKTLKKFLVDPTKIFDEDGTTTEEYRVHATCMELMKGAPYEFRIQKAYDQVVTLFGKAEENLDDFIRQSQISQAEAKKYFIEKFRIGKWIRTGIIWWNLVDGWPQVSDAIVDYYFVKKLAYHYIKRSQAPVCLMFDEPEDNIITLVGSNDLPKDVDLSYKVTRISKDSSKNEVVLSGIARVDADSALRIAGLPIEEGEKEFYLIEWECGEYSGKNHYFTNIIDIDYAAYLNALKQCGMDEFDF